METSSRLRFQIEEDGLKATVAVSPGAAVTAAVFDEALNATGIVAGVDREGCTVLAAELENPDFHCEAQVIAVGRACEPSHDAWLELVFAEGAQAGHLREDGSVDYHDRELLKAVRSGEVLAVFHPAETGRPGQKVDGSALLPVAPRELPVRFLAGVELGEDRKLRATRSGVILYVPGKSLNVVDHHVHEGSVDMHSGNLHMQGSLVIKGDVLHPFNVVTSGDLDVVGNVEVANIVSGGSLRIQRGVRGGEGSKIHAAADISIRHAQSAELCAGGTICAGEVINSHLVASEVRISGRLRGGLVEAETRIVIHEVGAANGTETELVAARPLDLPVDEARLLLTAEKATAREPKSSSLGRLAIHDREPRSSSLGRIAIHDRESKSISSPRTVSTAELQHLAQLERRHEELLDRATIEVEIAHPGVTLRIGAAHVTLTETVRSLRYHLDRESNTLYATKL